MTKANLLPGLLGKVLKRGTRVLRLAQAKVNTNYGKYTVHCSDWTVGNYLRFHDNYVKLFFSFNTLMYSS